MYPLYLLGILALVITIQRFFTSTRGRLAPKGLAEKVCACIEKQDYDAAVALCRKKPSTLGNALSFIVEHRDADWEAVCQTAGDMAARDIRGHLSRIYPLSVISSLSPLFRVVRYDCGHDRGVRSCGFVRRRGGSLHLVRFHF